MNIGFRHRGFGFGGYLDEMRMYDRMMSPAYITGAQSEKQKRKEGRTCPMPQDKQRRFPRK